MEDIKGIKDILRFIADSERIEGDSSGGSDIIIPVYEISAEGFLGFAERAIDTGTTEGLVNAVANLKRALDCGMDAFFESINLRGVFAKNNLKFEKKTQFMADIGLFPIRSINKLNLIRNKMEHEYRKPEISDLHTYYELVWSFIRILNLNLELLYVNGEINFTLQSGSEKYYLTMKHNVRECGFQFEIRDWTDHNEKKEKKISIHLRTKEDTCDFIKAFNLYLQSIQYFDFGNFSLYKGNVKKLIGD